MQISSPSLWFPLAFEPSQTTDSLRLRMGQNDDLESSSLLLLWFPPIAAASRSCKGEKWANSVTGHWGPHSLVAVPGGVTESQDHHSPLGETEVANSWPDRGHTVDHTWTLQMGSSVVWADELIRIRSFSQRQWPTRCPPHRFVAGFVCNNEKALKISNAVFQCNPINNSTNKASWGLGV